MPAGVRQHVGQGQDVGVLHVHVEEVHLNATSRWRSATHSIGTTTRIVVGKGVDHRGAHISRGDHARDHDSVDTR